MTRELDSVYGVFAVFRPDLYCSDTIRFCLDTIAINDRIDKSTPIIIKDKSGRNYSSKQTYRLVLIILDVDPLT